MKLYCISGLGVDHRVFRNLHVEGVELIEIPWIKPQKADSLSSYAKRLFEAANLPEDYHLIGVSFGGMIAQEFEKIMKPKSLFLVSTISSSSELSFLFKIGGKLSLHKLIPPFLLSRGNFLSNYLFGAKSKEDKELFNEILLDSDTPLISWALGAIVNWKNNSPTNGIRIHGGKDKVLPLKAKAEFFIPEAGHLMIATHGKELSAFLKSTFRK